MNAAARFLSSSVPARGMVVRWRVARALRRWPHHWFAILDSGRRSQDLWTAQDWTMWEHALNGISDLDQPLPVQAPVIGLGWTARQRQHRYAGLTLAGYTPLVLALRLRDPAPFQALLDAGADPHHPGTPRQESPVELLRTLSDAYRSRRWGTRAGDATPQPWHALMLHKLDTTASRPRG